MQILANIDVDDVEKAMDFYGRAVGLRPGRRLFGGAVVEMLGASSPIYLIEKAAGTRAAGAECRDYARHWTPVHLDFVVADLDAAVRRAREAGAVLEGDPTTAAWGRFASFADPFGHGFCLVQLLGRGYDEVASA
jgi:lactoylglutathione lyase